MLPLRCILVPLFTLLAALISATVARGHGVRLPFDEWGAFSGATLRCQRVIARAAADCAAARWTVRRTCRRTELAGGTCNRAADDAIIAAARNNALDVIDGYCTERQLGDLQFLGQFDLQGDVDTFSRDWEIAAMSAVYGPAANRVLTDGERYCIEAAADAVDGMMAFVFRERRRCMDRVAALARALPTRHALLDASSGRSQMALTALGARLARRCGAAEFTALYGQSPAAFVASIGRRADCLGAQFYIQDAVLCAPAECGNGIIEPGEDCDDGNADDDDACPASCRR